VLAFSVPSDREGRTHSASLLCLFVYGLPLHNNWDGVHVACYPDNVELAGTLPGRVVLGPTETLTWDT